MKRFLLTLLGISFLVISLARADVAPTVREKDFCVSGTNCNYNLLNAVAGNADASYRTVTQSVSGISKLMTVVKHKYAAGTGVTVTCTGSIDGVLYGSLTSRSISSGTSTVSPLVDGWSSSSGDTVRVLEYDVFGLRFVSCVYALTGSPTSSDKITVQWGGGVGK